MENLTLNNNLMQGYQRLLAVIIQTSQPAIQIPSSLRQLEKKILRKLKHPARKNKLVAHLDRDKITIGGSNEKQ